MGSRSQTNRSRFADGILRELVAMAWMVAHLAPKTMCTDPPTLCENEDDTPDYANFSTHWSVIYLLLFGLEHL